MSTNKYYSITLLIEVPESEHKNWGASCDETFHGPGKFHSPNGDFSPHVIDYFEISKDYFDENKYNLFTEDGGI